MARLLPPQPSVYIPEETKAAVMPMRRRQPTVRVPERTKIMKYNHRMHRVLNAMSPSEKHLFQQLTPNEMYYFVKHSKMRGGADEPRNRRDRENPREEENSNPNENERNENIRWNIFNKIYLLLTNLPETNELLRKKYGDTKLINEKRQILTERYYYLLSNIKVDDDDENFFILSELLLDYDRETLIQAIKSLITENSEVYKNSLVQDFLTKLERGEERYEDKGERVRDNIIKEIAKMMDNSDEANRLLREKFGKAEKVFEEDEYGDMVYEDEYEYLLANMNFTDRDILSLNNLLLKFKRETLIQQLEFMIGMDDNYSFLQPFLTKLKEAVNDYKDSESDLSSESDEYSDAPLDEDLEQYEIFQELFDDDDFISPSDEEMFGHGIFSSKNKVAPTLEEQRAARAGITREDIRSSDQRQARLNTRLNEFEQSRANRTNTLPVVLESTGANPQDAAGVGLSAQPSAQDDDDIPNMEGNFETALEQNSNLIDVSVQINKRIKMYKESIERTNEEIKKVMSVVEWKSSTEPNPNEQQFEKLQQLWADKEMNERKLKEAEDASKNPFVPRRENPVEPAPEVPEVPVYKKTKNLEDATPKEKEQQLRLLKGPQVLTTDDNYEVRRLQDSLFNKKSTFKKDNYAPIVSKLPIIVVQPKKIQFTRTEVVPDGYTKIDNKPLIKNTTLYPVGEFYNKDSMKKKYQRDDVWNRYEQGKPEYTVSRTTAQRRPGETLGAIFGYQTYINKKTRKEKNMPIKWEYSFKVGPDTSRKPILYTGEEWQLT